jgi:predicted ATP-grasp superfamily ATP-dependent carboligase
MNDDLKRSILELQLRRSNLVEELKEIDLQIQFLTEQLEKDDDL